VSVAVVTDSTAHLPEGFAERHTVRVVPLHVLVDGVVSLDGVETGPAAVAEAMHDTERLFELAQSAYRAGQR